MKLIEKLALAKKEIKETKVKKDGRNEFSKYDYFTPSQIEYLVQHVCFNQRLLTKFDLIRNELGVFGRLVVYDLDSEDTLTYEMASAIPEIKATNIAQQLGGCCTYTERYLKTSAFGITDNNLDFDSNNNEQSKPNNATKQAPSNEANPDNLTWLNKYQDKSKTTLTLEFTKVAEALKSEKYTMLDIRKKYKVSKETEKELNDYIL
jgi:hypothetical protein